MSNPNSPKDRDYIITEEDYDRLFSTFDEMRKKADKKRASLSNEEIHIYRARCKRDLFFLNTAICGNLDLQPKLHGEWCEYWEDVFYNYQFALGLLPRGHFKTSTKTVVDNIRIALPYTEEDRLCDEIARPLPYPLTLGPNVRILIVHEVEDEAARFLFQIAANFMSNPLLMAYYPECVPERGKQVINKTALTLPRDGIFGEPTFDAKGVSAKQQGNHYNVISPDDIYGKEARKSEAESQQRRDFIDGIFGFLNNLSIDKISGVGTRYKYDDVYGYMIDKFEDKLSVYRRKVVEKDSEGIEQIIFPERVTPVQLEIIKKNKEVYYSEWLNDPEEIGDGFNKEWWRTFEWLDQYRIAVLDGNPNHPSVVSVRDCYICLHIDPGEVTGGFVISATDYWWRTFTLGAIPIDFPSTALVELLFSQSVKWGVHLVTIEYDAAQHLLGDWVRSEMSNRNIYFEIHPYRTRKIAKTKRIESLGQLYSSNQLFHNDKQEELKKEFERFGKTSDIHILDALAQIMDEGVRRRGFPPGSYGIIGVRDDSVESRGVDPTTGYSQIEYGGSY